MRRLSGNLDVFLKRTPFHVQFPSKTNSAEISERILTSEMNYDNMDSGFLICFGCSPAGVWRLELNDVDFLVSVRSRQDTTL